MLNYSFTVGVFTFVVLTMQTREFARPKRTLQNMGLIFVGALLRFPHDTQSVD